MVWTPKDILKHYIASNFSQKTHFCLNHSSTTVLGKMKNPDAENIASTSTSINKTTDTSTSKLNESINYNSPMYTQQQGKWAMCGDMKSTHSDGCPKQGMICNPCDRPNHGMLYCHRIKRDIKKGSDTSNIPAKGKMYNKKGNESKNEHTSKKLKDKADDLDSDDDKATKKSKIKITEQSNESDDDAMIFMSIGQGWNKIFKLTGWHALLWWCSMPLFSSLCPSPIFNIQDFNDITTMYSWYQDRIFFSYDSPITSSNTSQVHHDPSSLDLYRAAYPEHIYVTMNILISTTLSDSMDMTALVLTDWTNASVTSYTASSHRTTDSHIYFEAAWDTWYDVQEDESSHDSPHYPESELYHNTMSTSATWPHNNNNDDALLML
jgi:hypothetical protein